MIDHIVGRPNPSWKRIQVFLVIFFWVWRVARGHSRPPRVLGLIKVNQSLQRYTPWQIIVSTLTALYALRNLDKILGLGAPEPLARLYSPEYYRATWINTGLEAGFATAMSIRPQWLRDACSILFSVYYIVFANEADEKMRRFKAVPTVEMLRTTWEKTSNPYIRMVTHLPKVSVRRKILLPRPKSSKYTRPITAYLFFSPAESQLHYATDLILDYPGGGFVAMNPEHHEERLRHWAVKTGKPVLSIDYGKAPEYPYPFAIDEAYDTYRVIVESAGTAIGMAGGRLNVIFTGDSAGATLAVSVVLKILEHDEKTRLPLPLSVVLSYPALDFNFTSWMSPTNLKVLQSEESSGNLPGLSELAAQKDHLQHISPLSMVDDKAVRPGRLRRKGSWKDTFRGLTRSPSATKNMRSRSHPHLPASVMESGELADSESGDDYDSDGQREEDRPLKARVRYSSPFRSATEQEKLSAAVEEANSQAMETHKRWGRGKEPIGTRLTMTSRTGFFQDRIISPSLMRAMAILYIGPNRNPDFATDYHISPILTPERLLAQFPPLLMQCGEKDPLVDDTVIFAGRVREAKRARKQELEMAIAGKSARFGEGLKMSRIEGSTEALRMEREKLSQETEDDWVQLVLFSDWSHGYLQMATLMKEARVVINDLAGWIDDAFLKYGRRGSVQGRRQRTEPEGRTGAGSLSETEWTDGEGITFVPKRSKKTCSPPRSAVTGGATEEEMTEGRRSPSRQMTAGQAGLQITEEELIRRRRLLDSHIFE